VIRGLESAPQLIGIAMALVSLWGAIVKVRIERQEAEVKIESLELALKKKKKS
jgi:hypothetical protein